MSSLLEGLPPGMVIPTAVTVALALAYAVADATARLLKRAVASVVSGLVEGASPDVLKSPVRVVRVVVFLLAAALFIGPALRGAGVAVAVGPDQASLGRWFFESGLRIGLIILIAFVVLRTTRLLVTRFEQELGTALGGEDVPALERLKRAQTLGRLALNVARTLVVFIAGLMSLRELDIDIVPILTGASVVGLAVGFGAQTLVKDVISGFFLLLENQVRVGDVARINDVGGAVEAITLRTIVLRDQAGTVHVVPNGSINTLANLTKDFSFALLDVGVAYEEDVDRVMEALAAVGRDLEADDRFKPDLLGSLEILGVDNFGASEVVIRLRIRTRPSRQWSVSRELRRRIKKRFDQDGIEMPFPQRTVTVRRESPARPDDGPDAGRTAL